MVARLPAVLNGVDRPSNTVERLDFALMGFDAQDYAPAVQLYQQAFLTEPAARRAWTQNIASGPPAPRFRPAAGSPAAICPWQKPTGVVFGSRHSPG